MKKLMKVRNSKGKNRENSVSYTHLDVYKRQVAADPDKMYLLHLRQGHRYSSLISSFFLKDIASMLR